MQPHLCKPSHGLKLITLFVFLGLLSSCDKNDHWPPKATEESADVLYDWYRLGMRIQLYSSPPPPVPLNSRNYGYIGVGLYEAVRPGIKGAVSLSTKLYQMPPIPEPENFLGYSWGASANAAMASLFKQFLAGLTEANIASIDSLEQAYNNKFRLSVSDAVISRSQGYGRAVAAIIYNWSTTDNFNLSSAGYVLPVFPGSWVPTPPAFANPVGPYLPDSRPFLQSSSTTTYPPLPFPYSEEPKSDFYKAAKEVYDVGNAKDPAQQATAGFWADVGGVGVGYPGPCHVISLITDVLENEEVSLGKAAEIYAKTGIAFKDAFIVVWSTKFKENLLRPITYINNLIDPAWTSYLVNPPYPDYPSGLAGLYTPSMQVLIREFGDIPVTDRTYALNGTGPREYASISKLVYEAAISRLYAGIHYKFTQLTTIEEGKKLGNRIADIKLLGRHR